MITQQIQDLIDNPDTLVVSNHSGGKDSQAMYLYLRDLVPSERLVVIHSHLPEVEWEGTENFIRSTVSHEVHVVQAGKTFFDMVEHRQQFPSPSYRQCTSDLKRAPIAKKIRQLSNDRGFKTILNCMGLRAEESAARAKKKPLTESKRNSNSKRKWFDWLPVLDWKEARVFKTINQARQRPFWTYSAGLSRKGCSFCIMASESDLCISAKLRPTLLEKYDSLETSTGRTMMMPTKKNGKRSLKQIIDDKIAATPVKSLEQRMYESAQLTHELQLYSPNVHTHKSGTQGRTNYTVNIRGHYVLVLSKILGEYVYSCEASGDRANLTAAEAFTKIDAILLRPLDN